MTMWQFASESPYLFTLCVYVVSFFVVNGVVACFEQVRKLLKADSTKEAAGRENEN